MKGKMKQDFDTFKDTDGEASNNLGKWLVIMLQIPPL